MSLTPEQMRALAIDIWDEQRFVDNRDYAIQLVIPIIAAYTAAVEAKERATIANWLYKTNERLIITGEYKL